MHKSSIRYEKHSLSLFAIYMNMGHARRPPKDSIKEQKTRQSLKTSEEVKIQVDEYSLESLGRHNLFFQNEQIFMDSILEIYLDSIKKIRALRKNAKQIIATAFFRGKDFLNQPLSKCLENVHRVRFLNNRKWSSNQQDKLGSTSKRISLGNGRRYRKQSSYGPMGLYDRKLYEYLRDKDFPLYNVFENKIRNFKINGKCR